VFCLNPDGTARWSRRRGSGPNRAFAIAADGSVYFTHPLTAYGPQGDTLWLTADSCLRPPAIAPDGTLYIPNSGQLACRGADGSYRWQARIGSGYLNTPAIAADGTVYVIGGRYLYAFQPDGTLRWCSYLPRNPDDGFVTIGRDGTVYVCGEDELFAVIGSAPLADSPWPKYQRDLQNSGRAGGP
jgi:outer membrane protein assembly factor BamB